MSDSSTDGSATDVPTGSSEPRPHDAVAVETDRSPAPDPRVSATAAPIIPLLPYQREAVESAARFRWCCWSRQTGKSFTSSLRRVLRGVMRRRNQILLSAGERQSRELMSKVRQHCRALQIATEFAGSRALSGTRFKELEVRLPNGVRIIGLPANPQTARGYTGDVLLDEFAMHADDREIWAAMFPSVLRGEGEVDVASTPKGRSNVFYRLSENELFEKSVVTLPDAVAAGLDVGVDEIRGSMDGETLFRQEFLCEFLDETTAFLTYEMIAACTDSSLAKEPDWAALAKCTDALFAGVDIGRRRDLTVMWIVEPVDDALVTRGVIELSAAPFREQAEVLERLLALPAMRRCCVDAGGVGMQLAETAEQRHGPHRVEAITFTQAVKSQLAGALRLAIEARRISVPDDDRIREDLHSIRRMVTASGHIRLDAARSSLGHGDRFWAAALAVHAAVAGAARLEQLRTGPLRFSGKGIW